MATFDQLPAEQRAIIELVVARGRSYDALADVLQVPAQRVRELAREALVELSPITGERVDPKWRGQVADYLLGQQSGAESKATQTHLRRSEPARSWALSLLDALDTLFANGDRPAVPEAEAAAEVATEDGAETKQRERVRERERGARPSTAATKVRERPRGAGAKERDRVEEPDEKKPDEKKPDERKPDEKKTTRRGQLSPAAQSALRRRRIIGAAAAVALVVAIVIGVLAATGAFSGDDGGGGSSASADTSAETGTEGAEGGTPTTPAPPSDADTQIVGQIPLRPVDGAKAQGIAYILKRGNEQVLAITAKLPPLPRKQREAAYNVWLYNSDDDVQTMGAQFTQPNGDYQGAGKLPEDFSRFKFVDVSRQPFSRNQGHSGNSVLRGSFADLQPVPEDQQGAAPGAGGQPPAP
jgi:hypothetical protein